MATAPERVAIPFESQFDELSAQVRTAQAEIGQIRLERDDEKKPWWKQTAIVISIVGLLISSIVSFYTLIDQAHQRKTTALDTSLADIVALRMEDARQAVALAATNPNAYRTWGTAAQVKRVMLLVAALAAVRELDDKISANAAFAIGSELIVDGRYTEAEKILNIGMKAAQAAKSPTAGIQSVEAQVYLLPGSPLINPSKGRALYHEAFDSFLTRTDSAALNGRIGMIVWWATAEASLGNRKESAGLIQLARQSMAASLLSPSVKLPLTAMIDATANQLQATASTPADPARILGQWLVSGADGKPSSLIIASTPASSSPVFVRDQIDEGTLGTRINGTIFVTDANNLRLDWNSAFSTAHGAMGGFSEVRLNPDGTMNGVDYSFGSPSQSWTAKKNQPVQRTHHADSP